MQHPQKSLKFDEKISYTFQHLESFTGPVIKIALKKCCNNVKIISRKYATSITQTAKIKVFLARFVYR